MGREKKEWVGEGNYIILDSGVAGKQLSEASKRGLEVELQWDWRAGED